MGQAATTTDSEAVPPTTTRYTCCCGSRTEGLTMRTSETHHDRPLIAGRAQILPLLICAAVLASGGAPLRAGEPDPSARAPAQKLAVTVCGTCHGQDGNNTQPKFPRLAGQNPTYLAAQLK